jgi:hypothetical protein
VKFIRQLAFLVFSILLFICCGGIVKAADEWPPEPQGYFVNPIFSPDGKAIIATNESYSSLYLISVEDGSINEILHETGCGFRPSFHPDGKKLGIKIIRKGLQIPCVLSLETGQIKELLKPVPLAGEVSFSLDGEIAFTIGNDLIVIDSKGRTKSFPLGVYTNIAPISPDGNNVAFNDDDDQIWFINIATGKRKKITQDDRGYFNPRWSPDNKKILLSSLDEHMKVIDIETGEEFDLGSGSSPRWSPDGNFICYHLKEIEELRRLIGSDIYIAKYDGTRRYRVTSTPNIFEMHPSFSPDGNKIVHDTYEDRKIFMGYLGKNYTLDSLKLIREEPKELKIKHEYNQGINKSKSLDVPYIHQVYDVPDWFSGYWACAPTTAMMAIAYYQKLPYWDCQCHYHKCHWGKYICEQYNYREVTYSWRAKDPNDTWAKGGYGYMWSGSNRPSNSMHNYISKHGMSSKLIYYPSWSNVVNELNQDYPYALCVGLTTSGHLVLAIGYVSDQHTIICNDPYGNKNTPGYPGKDVLYDWPGYNYGYRNLNTVYWAARARGSLPAATDTIVDDLAIHDGYYMHTYPNSPKDYWHWFDALTGFEDHMWWTYTKAAKDTYYVTWTPDLPQPGNYEVLAYIPNDDATATSANYKIYHSTGSEIVTVNQDDYSDQWVSLGTYPFEAGTGGYVRLGDSTGTTDQKIGFDAIKWSYRTTHTLAVVLTVNPTSGPAPLSVDLTANVGGTATGTINYNFWWNCNSPDTTVDEATSICGDPEDPAIGARFDEVDDDSIVVNHIYKVPGTYTAKVVVEREVAAPAEARLTLVVSAPETLALFQNIPNPFVSNTTICYQLPARTNVSLKIYRCTGQLVRTLVDRTDEPGYYEIPWDGEDDNGKEVSNGIYFYRAQIDDFTEIKKMILIK